MKRQWIVQETGEERMPEVGGVLWLSVQGVQIPVEIVRQVETPSAHGRQLGMFGGERETR